MKKLLYTLPLACLLVTGIGFADPIVERTVDFTPYKVKAFTYGGEELGQKKK